MSIHTEWVCVCAMHPYVCVCVCVYSASVLRQTDTHTSRKHDCLCVNYVNIALVIQLMVYAMCGILNYLMMIQTRLRQSIHGKGTGMLMIDRMSNIIDTFGSNTIVGFLSCPWQP